MTSRERVLAAFDHREPDRVPAWCGSSPEFWAKAESALALDDEGLRGRLGDDFRRVYAAWRGPDAPLSPGATSRSPFFRPLIPSMITAGLDGLHALQPSCEGMEPAGLKRDFGGRILLNGAIDSHHVLIEGTPEGVREQTRRTLDILSPGGGYVAGASHDSILEETPLANVLAMFDTIRDYRRN